MGRGRFITLPLLCALLTLCASCTDRGAAETAVTAGAVTSQTAAESEITSGSIQSAADMQSWSDFTPEQLDMLKNGASPHTAVKGISEQPKITMYKQITNTKFFVCGKVSPYAAVHIRGGVTDMTFYPDDDNFWGAVDIPAKGTSVITVTAEESGRAESVPLTYSVQARDDVYIFENHGVCGVVVGNNFQGHFQGAIDDYTGANLLSDTQREGVKKAAERNVSACEKNGAKLLYILIPNPMTIYPETVPSEYVRYTDDSLTSQFSEIVKQAGADVIDLTETFLAHRDDDFKLFNKMDSHWTEYGAYYAYLALTDYLVSDGWEDAEPRDESLFRFYKEDRIAGDMCTHLEIPNKSLHEMTTVCDLLFESPYDPDFFMPGKNEVEHSVTSGAHRIVNADKSRTLPRAMIYRDSFSSAVEAMANDTFSVTNWRDMWSYQLEPAKIKATSSDYVIYLIAERNIKNIMY
ncbi:MAG: hypothetical protein WCQ72_01480 [Eubacteriales bacterium]